VLNAHGPVTQRDRGICLSALDSGEHQLTQFAASLVDDLIEDRVDGIWLEGSNFGMGSIGELLRESRPCYSGQQKRRQREVEHGDDDIRVPNP
jgi:hypothetical protein